MRPSDLAASVLVLALVPACATSLPGGDLGAPDASDDGDAATPPLAPGCLPFRSLPGVDAVTGAVRSVAQPDGGALFVVDDAVSGDADIPGLAITAPSTATADDCLAAAVVAGLSPASAFDPPTLGPLSGVVLDGVPAFYYVDPTYGSVGVAAQDPSDGIFRPEQALLWTADRPTYGTAAVTTGGDVYALACEPARFLDADCYVARAPATSADDEGAYGYYVGGGEWSPRVDDAWPMTSGGSSVDLAWLPGAGRWLLAYVPPLGNTIVVRSGLTPEGPWSAPVPAATCDLADPDMFCGGVHLHPVLAAPAGSIVLSYAAASLSPDVAARRAAEPLKWWPRLVALALPALP